MDESGDHGLSNINPHFPVFLLCGALFYRPDYEVCDKAISDIKAKYWNNKTVIFHSRDIRKCQKEFQILLDLEIKSNFYKDLDSIITNHKYAIIADGISKEAFIKQYGKLANVYELCLSFIIERAVFYLDDIPGDKCLFIIIEERGNKENRQLKEHFNRLLERGTGYVSPDRLEALDLRIEFRSKKRNINGLQLVDLLAYPIASHIIDKKRANPAFDTLEPHFYKKYGKVYGLKTFP